MRQVTAPYIEQPILVPKIEINMCVSEATPGGKAGSKAGAELTLDRAIP